MARHPTFVDRPLDTGAELLCRAAGHYEGSVDQLDIDPAVPWAGSVALAISRSLRAVRRSGAPLNCAPRKNQNAGSDEASNEIAEPPTERDAKDS
jgi:hypothetical protein